MTTRRLSMVPGEALLTEGPEGRRSEALCTENYLLRFFDPVERRFRNFSASQFTDVWNHFDTDVTYQTKARLIRLIAKFRPQKVTTGKRPH
ncbi:hypothetical protein T265_10857 [Opisthorchis viverrini]|uniref:Uncharacterized protein n=1 Tax=Opisthorchis viverrini TaxID=6198 RepID=A0A074ZZT2_OPIVI|nr:hypothetical protein T265_10857 [Opisthorchis viverrini]KER20649.1 hypothetical protein T265_10857 [Opisthorchis viverrini]